MLTIETVKCRVCGTRHPARKAVCPSCGTLAAPTAAPPGGKPQPAKARPEPRGLDSEELLAKINSLDWDPQTIQPQGGKAASAAAPPPPPAQKRALLLPFLVGFGVLLTGALALRYYGGQQNVPVIRDAASTPARADDAAALLPPTPAMTSAATASAQETAPDSVAGDAEAQAQAAREEARRQRAELRRKALAAKQALEEKTRQERAEQDRLRAEKEAAEARARAAAQAAPTAQRPSSPQDICSDQPNPFRKGACEARICAEAQWRTHPYCLKRWQDELRKLSPGAIGG